MKTLKLINMVIPAMALSLWSSSAGASGKSAQSVSAGIRATARVVPSQGMTIEPIDLPTPGESGQDSWWLWLPDNDNLKVQVEADGRPVGIRVLDGESGLDEATVLKHHRRNDQVRHRLLIDSLPEGAVTCTVTIVNPTN